MEKVVVLMSTYNGEKYLEEQIKSIINQKDVQVDLFVRDDGSNDTTLEILSKYEKKNILKLYTGQNLKSAYSFMDLIMNAPNSEYYAFADQDDVWREDKLIRAIKKIKSYNNDIVPRLYSSNYQLVDSNLNKLPNNKHVTTTNFEESLVASCCTGCTVVFNKALLNYLRIDNPKTIVMHDDWVHKVCLAIGGTVYFDNERMLMYRQHGKNVDGGIHSFRNRTKKILERMCFKDCIRSKQIAELIRIYGNYMPKEYRDLAQRVACYREKNLIERILLAFDKRIKTQYRRLNRGYRVAIILKYF